MNNVNTFKIRKQIKKFQTIFALFAACALVLIAITSQWNESVKSSTSTSSISSSSISSLSLMMKQTKIEKPIMYTFFEGVPGGCCGADEEGHQELLNSWSSAWKSNGWETRLLTVEDAKLHDDFDKLIEIMNSYSTPVTEYNTRCFYRWLAMAANPNGGWMSDYDLFPLGFSSEDSQKFVESNVHGTFSAFAGPVPALLYASQKEWQRLVDLMLDAIPNQTGFISDMIVLKKIIANIGKEGVGIYYRPDTFVSTRCFHLYNQYGQIECDGIDESLKAVHFSHHCTYGSFEAGVFPIKKGIHKGEDAIQNRGKATDMFMKDYMRQCLSTK
mmetsp:Transcript_10670/g.13502  ORF Transcript_10670/g.13502 Transcript_10670/m.13502 type:complete len:329 (-) Transcript_10670:142-1128(-)